MEHEISDVLRKYLFTESSIFVLLCSSNGRITETNKFTRDLLGFDPVFYRLRDVFVDFSHEVDESKVFIKYKTEKLLNVKSFTGLPMSLYFRFFDLGNAYLVLGRQDSIEDQLVRQKDMDVINQLNILTRQLMKLQSEKDKAEQIRKELINLTSGSLRNSVHSVLRNCDYLRQKIEAREDQAREILSEIEEESLNLQNGINYLLNYLLLIEQKIHLDLVQVDLTKLIEEEIKQKKQSAALKQREIIFKPPSEEIHLICDKQKISQVISELLCNALSCSSKDSSVNIELENLEAKVKVSIIDEGCGISPEKQKEIFKFHSINKNKLFSGDSCGMGLIICKKIITAHKGKISYSSNSPKGSTFTFTLPKNQNVNQNSGN